MSNMSGDWGHNDWNGNGKYDSYDNMMDYEFEQEYYKGSTGGYRSSGRVGKGFWITVIIGLVLGAINELLGAIILFFCLWYLIFFT